MILFRRVVGDSMAPTLKPDKIVVATALFQRYKPGDVVILEHDGIDKIKRITDVRFTKNHTEVFVSGDNEQYSIDSRQFGWLPTQSVKGKVIWPTRIHQNLTSQYPG